MITHVECLIFQMKTKIDGVLIVEGNSDVSYLSGFLDAQYFVTNGLDISKDKIVFLKEAIKENRLIIFTDPDGAGETIKNKLINEIQGICVAFLRGNSRKNYKKHGVAEAKKEDILEALKEYKTEKEIFRENYNLVSLISLSENPQKNKDIIIQKYHLIPGNNKSLENQLNILKITKEELWKLIEATSTK